MTSFNNVKIGERFFYNGWEYIKICCPESGTVGAVELYSGTYYTTDCENSDCGNWLVDVPTLIDVPTKQTKEKKTKQDNEIAIFVSLKTWKFAVNTPLSFCSVPCFKC